MSNSSFLIWTIASMILWSSETLFPGWLFRIFHADAALPFSRSPFEIPISWDSKGKFSSYFPKWKEKYQTRSKRGPFSSFCAGFLTLKVPGLLNKRLWNFSGCFEVLPRSLGGNCPSLWGSWNIGLDLSKEHPIGPPSSAEFHKRKINEVLTKDEREAHQWAQNRQSTMDTNKGKCYDGVWV